MLIIYSLAAGNVPGRHLHESTSEPLSHFDWFDFVATTSCACMCARIHNPIEDVGRSNRTRTLSPNTSMFFPLCCNDLSGLLLWIDCTARRFAVQTVLHFVFATYSLCNVRDNISFTSIVPFELAWLIDDRMRNPVFENE